MTAGYQRCENERYRAEYGVCSFKIRNGVTKFFFYACCNDRLVDRRCMLYNIGLSLSPCFLLALQCFGITSEYVQGHRCRSTY